MSEHTKGPWEWWCGNSWCEVDGCTAHGGPYQIGVHGDSGGVHAEVLTGLADARRIVVCVNALEGISPEAVPELLKAAKAMVVIATTPPWEPNDAGEALEDLESAIAKAG